MKKTIVPSLAVLVFLAAVLFISRGAAYAADDQIMGFPVYPGAKHDPANPPIDSPRMKNMNLLSGDSFEKVVGWYGEKLGKFEDLPSPRGKQATWHEEEAGGWAFRTVTISTIDVPAGRVKITATKMSLGQ